MKLLIISDVKGKQDSIIPYGLNLAKQLRYEADIVHIVDSRVQQGTGSSYADSQSISAGNKLSHTEIIAREKNEAKLALDDVLSREASRLNYPIKHRQIIEEGTLINYLSERYKQDPDILVIFNAMPDQYNFHSESEIYETAKQLEANCIVVPPSKHFKEIHSLLLLTDFDSEKNFNKYTRTHALLENLHPFINAVEVAKPKNFNQTELLSRAWQQTVEETVFSNANGIKTTILSGQDYLKTIKSFINDTQPDLILPVKTKNGTFSSGFGKNLYKTLTSELHCPVLMS